MIPRNADMPLKPHPSRHRVLLLIPIFVLVAIAILGGHTIAKAEVSVPSPTAQAKATTSQTSDNEVETDLITGGSTVAGAIVGGFFAWLSGVRIAARRERYDERTARRALILDYENSVLEFADAVAKEIDSVTDATRMNAEIRTDVAAGHTMIRADKVEDETLIQLNRRLAEMPKEWRNSTSVTSRAAILGGIFKETLSQILNRVQVIYTSEELRLSSSAPTLLEQGTALGPTSRVNTTIDAIGGDAEQTQLTLSAPLTRYFPSVWSIGDGAQDPHATTFVVGEANWLVTTARTLANTRCGDSVELRASKDDRSLVATVVFRDDATDVSILRSNEDAGPPLALCTDTTYHLGDKEGGIVEINGDGTANSGVLMSVGRVLDDLGDRGELGARLPKTASGNSGAPVLNAAGEVLGMVTGRASEMNVLLISSARIAWALRRAKQVP